MKLQEYVDRHGWRQADLARVLGTTRQTVQQWYAGKTRPSLYHGLAIERLTRGAVTLECWLSRQEQLALEALERTDDMA